VLFSNSSSGDYHRIRDLCARGRVLLWQFSGRLLLMISVSGLLRIAPHGGVLDVFIHGGRQNMQSFLSTGLPIVLMDAVRAYAD